MCLGLKTPFGEKEERIMVDKRRYGVIEVRFCPGPPAIYSLMIGGRQWAAVEWSASRRTWCIEDAAGHCLAHCEHIHGDNIDRPTAIALAKRMIVDGTIPTPEEASRQLAAEHAAEERRHQAATKPTKPRRQKRPSRAAAAEAKRLQEAAADGMRQLEAMRQPEAQPVALPPVAVPQPQPPRRRRTQQPIER
jgi:hypothetical protein